MNNKHLIIIGILLIIIVFFSVLIIGSIPKTPTKTIEINDLNIEQDEFGIYNLKGHITPLQDFDYLEARMIFYDAQDTIIGTGYAWNMNNPPKDSKIDVSSGLGGTCNGNPSYALVSFYDSPGSDDSLIDFKITFK